MLVNSLFINSLLIACGLWTSLADFDFHSLFKQRKVLLFDIKDDTFSSRYVSECS